MSFKNHSCLLNLSWFPSLNISWYFMLSQFHFNSQSVLEMFAILLSAYLAIFCIWISILLWWRNLLFLLIYVNGIIESSSPSWIKHLYGELSLSLSHEQKNSIDTRAKRHNFMLNQRFKRIRLFFFLKSFESTVNKMRGK